MRVCMAALGVLFAIAGAPAAKAQESLAILRLDGLSFISFEGREVFAIPSGSTVGFRFGRPTATAIPFTIQPSDVSIPPIETRDGAILRYALASATSGSIQRSADGQAQMTFPVTIRATLDVGGGSTTSAFSLVFTTGTASAKSADGQRTAQIEGMKLVESAGYVQLVGAVTNRADAYTEPGAAVSAVLSGTFDRLPQLK